MDNADLEKAESLIETMRSRFTELSQSVHQTVIGQKDIVRLLSTGLMCGGHMLMIGVPGLAKTLLVRTLADALGWDFRRIQFTPDLMPSDITGTEILQRDDSDGRRDMRFVKGPIFANLILADEINRTPPKTQAALLEAMQERAVTVGGQRHAIRPPFVVVATQNPIEQEGTYPLPEAQLDRFMFSIEVGYPEKEDEIAIAAMPSNPAPIAAPVRSSIDDWLSFIAAVESVPASRYVLEYAVSLTRATRPADNSAPDFIRQYLSWGVGPRCAQHLIRASKAAALMDGRPAPETRDIRALAPSILRHRLVLNYNALGEGLSANDIIARLLDSVREPSV
mgnify:CR=1 FL=1